MWVRNDRPRPAMVTPLSARAVVGAEPMLNHRAAGAVRGVVTAAVAATLIVVAAGATPAQPQSTWPVACAEEREAQRRASDEINRLSREMGRAMDPATREALIEQLRRAAEQRRAVDQRLSACMRED